MQGLQEKFLLFRVLRFRDKQAYGELYTAFAPRIRRYLLFKLPSEQDADEILAEIFLKAWDYLTSTPVESLGGLLFSVGRRRVADFYRSRGKEEVPSEEIAEAVFTDTGSGAAKIRAIAEAELIREAVKRLPPDQEVAILLRYFDGLSVSEVAEHLGKTDNHVRVLTHRGLKTMREDIEQRT